MLGGAPASRVATTCAAAALTLLGGCRNWAEYDPLPGDGGTAGSGPERCGGIGVLADDFDDGTIAETWMVSGEETLVSEQQGHLVFDLPVDRYGLATVESEYAYDLVGRALSIEAVQLPTEPADADVHLRADYADGDFVLFQYAHGDLIYAWQKLPDWQTLASQRYDPLLHRYWRLREQDGSVYWETSADNVEWTERATAPVADLFDMHFLRIHVRSSGSGNGSPAAVHLDNMNGGSPAVEARCPAHVLTDDFGDGQRARAWASAHEEPGCTAIETDGELVITTQPGQYHLCDYASISAYDLWGSSVTVEVITAPGPSSPAELALLVRSDWPNTLMVEISGDQLVCVQTVGSNSTIVGSKLYSPADHRWLRLREQDGLLHCEASPDAATWDTVGSMSPHFDLGRVQLVLRGVAHAAAPGPIEMRLDNFNLPP